jgi:Transposase DDE domain group 1
VVSRQAILIFNRRAGSGVRLLPEVMPGLILASIFGLEFRRKARPAENVVSFYKKRGTCEQWIKEGKGAIKWTRLSCRSFAANAVRLQLAMPEPIKDWSLTSLKEKLIKTGAKVVNHPLRRLPDSRGRHSEKFVRRDFAAHRRIATTGPMRS